MTIPGPDQLVGVVLPPALEVLTAWSIAQTDADPAVFRQALDRTIGDALDAPDPLRGLAERLFGLSCLSGILLDELTQLTGRPPARSCTTWLRHYAGIRNMAQRYLTTPT